MFFCQKLAHRPLITGDSKPAVYVHVYVYVYILYIKIYINVLLYTVYMLHYNEKPALLLSVTISYLGLLVNVTCSLVLRMNTPGRAVKILERVLEQSIRPALTPGTQIIYPGILSVPRSFYYSVAVHSTVSKVWCNLPHIANLM